VIECGCEILGPARCWFDATRALSMECGTCCTTVPEPGAWVLWLAALAALALYAAWH